MYYNDFTLEELSTTLTREEWDEVYNWNDLAIDTHELPAPNSPRVK